MRREKRTYVEWGRELGYAYYTCSSCGGSLTKIVNRHLEEIILAKLENKDAPKLYCP